MACAVDLLTWPDFAEACERAALAEQVRVEAARKYAIAPHGERQTRLQTLQAATVEALAAAVALSRVADSQ